MPRPQPWIAKARRILKERIVALRSTTGRWIAVVDARLKRTTVRERVLLGGLILGALAYGPVAALEWRTTQDDRYVEAMTQVADARRARDAARRVNNAAGDRAAVADMNGWGFEASNVAVAQVVIEQRLNAAAYEAGFRTLTMSVDGEVEDVGPTQWLSADVQTDLTWRSIFAFLENLSAWPEGFRVEGFGYEYGSVPAVQQDPTYGYGAGSGQMRPTGKAHFRLAFSVKIPAEDAAS